MDSQLTTIDGLPRWSACRSRRRLRSPHSIAQLRGLRTLALKSFANNENSVGGLCRAALAALSPAIGSLAGLRQLDMMYATIGPDGMRDLSAHLSSLTALASLDLSRNALGVAGAAALADLLPALPGLRELCVGENDMGADGVEKLFGAPPPAMRQLQQLRLNDNGFGAAGAVALARLLPDLAGSLTELDLSSNDLAAAGVAALAPALRRLSRLRALALSGNKLGIEAATVLSERLRLERDMPGLTSLDLSYNRLLDGGAAALAPLLRGMRQRLSEHLSMDGNAISIAGLAGIWGP